MALGCAAALASGCARPAPRAASAQAADEALAACEAPAEEAQAAELPTADPPDGEPVVEVKIEGARRVPEAVLRPMLRTRPGAAFDSEGAEADVQALFSSGVFEGVRLLTERREGGVEVVVRVSERPTLRRVVLAPGSRRPEGYEWKAPLPGDLHEPAVVDRALRMLRQVWVAQGYLDASVEARSRRVDDDHVDLCLRLDPGKSWKVEGVEFAGASAGVASALGEILAKEGSFNQPDKPYRADHLEGPLLRMQAALYERGLLASKVRPARAERDEERRRVRLVFEVEEGHVFRVGRLDVAGKLAGPRRGYLDRLGVAPGEVFVRSRFVEGLERVRAHHRAARGKDEEITPSTTLHEPEGLVDVVLQVGGT